MSIFVLVPGAWHGGWCWKKLVPLLRVSGHEVYTPTLTGLGERSHLLSHKIDLHTHIMDIVNLLEFEDLTNVILVGHSYASAVIEGVAEIVPHRLSRLVNLDGDILSNGQSFLDAMNLQVPKFVEELRQLVMDEGEGWLIPFSERMRMLASPEKGGMFGVTDKEDLKWMRERLTSHPMATFEQKERLVRLEAVAIPRTFIWCSVFDGKKIAERPSLPSNWDFREIETGHDAMISAPHELSEILERLA
jgi:pimeloyl-ACP methyl ester carboxylesterase